MAVDAQGQLSAQFGLSVVNGPEECSQHVWLLLRFQKRTILVFLKLTWAFIPTTLPKLCRKHKTRWYHRSHGEDCVFISTVDLRHRVFAQTVCFPCRRLCTENRCWRTNSQRYNASYPVHRRLRSRDGRCVELGPVCKVGITLG